jgi:CRAL/TRIO domain
MIFITLQRAIMVPLPKLINETAPRILLYNPLKSEPEDYSMMDAMKAYFMAPDFYIHNDDQLAIAGAIILVDLKNLSFSSVVKMNPSIAKKIIFLYTEANLFHIQGIHIINTPGFFEKIIKTIIMPFLNENMKKGVSILLKSRGKHRYISFFPYNLPVYRKVPAPWLKS